MAFEFRFPDVGEGIHEGKIVEWLVKEGDFVETDQPFVKIETDKAVVELPAPKKGFVLKILYEKGATINVGDIIAIFGEKGEEIKTERSEPASKIEQKKEEKVSISSLEKGKILATPHTRSLARKLGVDLTLVTPTGKSGRITDEDVYNFSKQKKLPIEKPRALRKIEEIQESARETRVELTHLRKVIAQNMAYSKQRSAHVTHIDEADVTNLYNLYKETKDELLKEGIKMTLLPFFVKAMTLCLKEFPKFNASVDEEKGEFVFKNYFNIGFAVDTEEGLIVPVIKNADKLSLVEIAKISQELAQKAKERKLTLDDLKGGTCTLTNIGPLGGVFATPIIHQPELSIVGFHTIKDRAWVVDGEIKIRKIMYVSISFDHKYIDGAEAARFMSRLVNYLEKPYLIMAKG
ncbi:MAG: 2-oxo acid dehydrogenase subunit E2 [Acidobacteria bacterium]|nr:2-oxo acid dehydrogenase subunit E2 [Acidobacteriota bacterium]